MHPCLFGNKPSCGPCSLTPKHSKSPQADVGRKDGTRIPFLPP